MRGMCQPKRRKFTDQFEIFAKFIEKGQENRPLGAVRSESTLLLQTHSFCIFTSSPDTIRQLTTRE